MLDTALVTEHANERLGKLNFLLSREGSRNFLPSFTEQTSKVFGADYLFIARINTTGTRMRTVHAAASGASLENFSYDLEGTPCDRVMRGSACVYEENVAALFPQDFMLEEMGINAYVAMPLFNGAQAVGIIVALFKSSIQDPEELLVTMSHYKRRITVDLMDAERHERAALAVEGTSDGIWDWSFDTDTLYMSARCRELLGYDARELSAMSDALFTLIHVEDKPRVNGALKAHRAGGRPFDLSMRMKTVGGSCRWFRIRGDAARTPDGEARRMVGTLTDIHDLVEARQQATEASRAKSKFIATMSHEIRTPMNGVLGMSSLLATTKLEPAQQDMVRLIEESGHALLGILNDILDLASIESGRFEIEPSQYNPADLIRAVTGPYRMKAMDKALNFQVDIDPCADHLVGGDPARVRQILSNLLSNAVKFTDRGEIRVRCLTTQMADGEHELSFEVGDTGIGMDDDLISRAFMPFSQGESAMSREHGGTGLGLAISKRLAELMGGDIRVESAPGAGAVFKLVVPAPSIDHPDQISA
jgi:PAS domain S-box-containing protein